MIGKLLVQEFITTRKALGAIGGWLFLIGLVGLVPVAIPIPYVSQLGNLMAILCFGLLVPVLLGYLAYSYWQTMYGRRGYFTMTIPVRGRVIYWTKVCHALLVSAVGLVISFIGLVIGTLATDVGARRALGSSFAAMWDSATSLYGHATLPLVIVVVAQATCFIMTIPAVMSITAQARYNHLGVGAPVIGGVMLYVVYQLSSLAGMLFIPFGMVLTGERTGQLVAQGMFPEILEMVRNPNADPGAVPQVLGLGMVLTSAALTVWLVWWGIRAIERRTSLR